MRLTKIRTPVSTMAGLVLLALLGLAACTPAAQPVTSPEDWATVNADGWSGRGFSLRLPPGWQLRELRGIDSYVGEIIGGGVRLRFDYGIYSNRLPYEDDPTYTVTYEEIGGRHAKLVRSHEGEAEGVTGVYFENYEPTLSRPGMMPLQLEISGTGLTSDQQDTAFAIFRSIRSLVSDAPSTPTATPWPTWSPAVRIDLRLDLDNGVVAVFEGRIRAERVAYVTHVPSGSQMILDRDGQMVQRHDGRDGGAARLDAVLADETTMQQIIAGVKAAFQSPGVHVDWPPFIMFDGITYRPHRPAVGKLQLTPDDLGPEFYRIAFELDGRVGGGYLPQNGDAAYLGPGTPIYTIGGYAPWFRLATVRDGRVTLYQASTNPVAQTGADLLDIRGRVRSISINSPEDRRIELASIGEPAMVERLVEMVLTAPVDQDQDLDRRDRDGERYYIVFQLDDGTTVSRSFRMESGELSWGIMTPVLFQASILQALAEAGR